MVDYYTLVRHSAFARGHDRFKQAVQVAPLRETAVETVLKAKGLVFIDYNEAFDTSCLVNFPDGFTPEGIPQASGTFASHVTAKGEDLYIPPPPPQIVFVVWDEHHVRPGVFYKEEDAAKNSGKIYRLPVL